MKKLEDRLRAVDLNPEAEAKKPLIAVYTYDASGERTIKYVPARTDARYSAKNSGNADRFESIIYPNALITAKALDFVEQLEYRKDPKVVNYTKHYYIGSERIASSIGTYRGTGGYKGTERDAVRVYLNNKVTEVADAVRQDFEKLEKHVQLAEPFVYDAGFDDPWYNFHDPEYYSTYWYHPDHLGSSSYITNLDGEISQHMEYLPFGETLVEEHLNSNNSPYKFNAKEFDAETGNYYYGARYYDSKWIIWLSVDPKAAEMPEWSPYSFSFNNPIYFIDPDGMKPTPSQAASMAWHIYDGKVGQVVDGWTLSNVYTDKDNLGYKAGLYTREVDGVMEYTMVNMGTIPGTGKENRNSMWENIEQPLGKSDHMDLSLAQARELSNTLGADADLTFVGHSKGGAEAAANAVATNRDAYVFNPAAVNLKAYGLNSKDYSASMTAFVVKGDPVAKTYPLFWAKPIDKLIMLPRQSWTNPIKNHNNFGEALRQYIENNTIQD